MENNKKQNYSRAGSKACQPTESNRKSDIQTNKTWARNSKRHEQNSTFRNEQQRNKPPTASKSRANGDKRTRARIAVGAGANGYNNSPRGKAKDNADNAGDTVDSTDDAGNDDDTPGARLVSVNSANGRNSGMAKNNGSKHELNSVYTPGSKKQNLNHLLNFHFTSRDLDYNPYSAGYSRSGRGLYGSSYRSVGGVPSSKKTRYNKEQFVQANFQFVIKNDITLKVDSPDSLIDWDLIEQINMQTIEEPQCPICLYPPKAAKITRCGHVFCWACLLHYLRKYDTVSGKCPLCAVPIIEMDLKSICIMQQRSFKIGEQITFQLMRRKKGSMLIEKFSINPCDEYNFPQYSSNDQMKLFSKFILATKADVLNILNREKAELTASLDGNRETDKFVNFALQLLQERHKKLKIEKVPSGNYPIHGNDVNHDYEEQNAAALATFINKNAENFDVAALFGQANGEENIQEKINEDENAEVVGNPKMQVDIKKEAETNNDTAENEATKSDGNGSVDSDIVLSPGEAAAANVQIDDVAAIAEFIEPSKNGTSIHKYYYFYQSEDGQNIFLHPINIKMLQAHYGSLELAPLLINARILQKENYSMNNEHRRKFTCLSHLPLTCQFAVYEVELRAPVVAKSILDFFKDDVTFRKKKREQRKREELRHEKKINEINDLKMGKFIVSMRDLKISSSEEFPQCGFDELLSTSADNIPNTPSTSAASNATFATSYSEVALRSDSPLDGFPKWSDIAAAKKPNAKQQKQPNAAGTVPTAATANNHDEAVDADGTSLPANTNLGDLLAEAISQKKQIAGANGAIAEAGHTAGGNNKKNKKNKKMVPLFSTGINYNGN